MRNKINFKKSITKAKLKRVLKMPSVFLLSSYGHIENRFQWYDRIDSQIDISQQSGHGTPTFLHQEFAYYMDAKGHCWRVKVQPLVRTVYETDKDYTPLNKDKYYDA